MQHSGADQVREVHECEGIHHARPPAGDAGVVIVFLVAVVEPPCVADDFLDRSFGRGTTIEEVGIAKSCRDRLPLPLRPDSGSRELVVQLRGRWRKWPELDPENGGSRELSSTVLLRSLENAPLSTAPSFSNIDTENDLPAPSFSFVDSENSAFFSLVVFLKFTRKLGIFHQLPHFLTSCLIFYCLQGKLGIFQPTFSEIHAKTRHFSA